MKGLLNDFVKISEFLKVKENNISQKGLNTGILQEGQYKAIFHETDVYPAGGANFKLD